MNKTLIVVLAVFAFFGSLLALGIGTYISAANYGNRTEKQIEATWENNQNILAQYSNRIAEMAQIPAMQRNDFLKVYTGAMEGRYGKDGSKAVFQWIQEQNPQLNTAVYTNIQTSMEAGRKDFEVAQTTLIDQKRAYETELGTVWRGFWLNLAGYPKIDLSKFKAITNDYAADAFTTGKENGIKLNQE